MEYKPNNKKSGAPIIPESVAIRLPDAQRNYLSENAGRYTAAWKSTWKMVELGIMVTGLPIKKQTFKEKQLMIKNFDQCVTTYNEWLLKNPGIAEPINEVSMKESMDNERKIWTNSVVKLPPVSGLLTTEINK